MSVSPETSLRGHTSAILARQWTINLIVLAIAATGYVDAARLDGLALPLRLYAWGTYLTHAGALCALLWTATAVLARLLPTRAVIRAVVPVIATALLAFAYIDQRVFAAFGFHTNGFVLQMALQHDFARQAGISRAALVAIAASALGVLAFQVALAVILERRAARVRSAIAVRPAMAGVVGLGILLADAAIFAWLRFERVTPITRLADALPFYPMPETDDLLARITGRPYDRLALPSFPATTNWDAPIHYPGDHPPISPSLAQRRPHIVWLVAESVRWDVITPETAPFLTGLATESLVARHALAAANCSHYAMFGLAFGLNASYWEELRERGQSSWPLRALADLGYDVRIRAAPSFDWLGMRSLFAEGTLRDAYPGAWPVDQDEAVVREFEQEPRWERPTFTLVFFESTHHNYVYPADHDIFAPTIDLEFSIHDLKLRRRREEIWNRYRNAVHWIDALSARIAAALRAKGVFDETILLFTGDHGEAFFEHGDFTHSSKLYDTQIRVPLILRLPGEPARVIDQPVSHTDVVPTMFDYLGAPIPVAAYGDGRSLLRDAPAESVLVAGCGTGRPDEYAVVTPELKVRFAIRRGGPDVREVLKSDDTPCPECQARATDIHAAVTAAFRRFSVLR